MKILLNKTKSSRDRYYLISGQMGSYGEIATHANCNYEIVNGIDRGGGYQVYMSVSYALKCKYFPQEAKDKVIEILKKENLTY
jgi:hypothetical protein